MAVSAKGSFDLLKGAAQDFVDDDCPRMAAALAYYTVFSLPPLLFLIITIAGVVLGQEAAEGQVKEQVSSLVGPEAAGQVQTMIENASERTSGGTLATLIGIVALVFGATGVFAQLQDALNRAWEVEPDPEVGGLKNFIFKRVLSLGMILGIGFLLLVSLALSALLTGAGNAIGSLLGGGASEVLLQVINFVISFVVIALLFAAIYKVMPDAEIAWRDVWAGAAGTAFLFVVGKFLIGLYLGNTDAGSAYGAAGSLAIILLWVYYAAMIILFGAEFTQAWAQRYGKGIKPDEDAVRVVEEKQHLRGEEAEERRVEEQRGRGAEG